MYCKEMNRMLLDKINELKKQGKEKGLTEKEITDIENRLWKKKGLISTAAIDFVEEFKKEIDRVKSKK